MAKALGRHQPFIANIESGQRRVDVIEFLEISKAIGFDPIEAITDLLRLENDEQE